MTQRKKWTAVLLVLLCVLSAFSTAFSVSAAEQTCNVTVEMIGDGSVSDGTASANAGAFTAEYTVGQSVTLTATPADGRETAYWANAETERILSFTDTYTFTAGSDVYMYVDLEPSQDIAAQSGKHQVVYLSEGDNIMYSETVDIGSTAFYDSNIAPLTMYINGRTWTGWDKSPEEVAADSGRVFVHPTYEGTASYTVTTIIGDTVTRSQGKFGGNFNAYAPATLNGQSFSYWLALRDEDDPNSRDEIASFSNTYQFIVVMPITLRAVYGEETQSGAVTRVVGDVPEPDNDAITFYTERSVTSDYTVVESGLVMTQDVSIGNLEDVFVITPGDSRIRQGKSSSTSRNGTYYVRLTTWTKVLDEDTGVYYHPLIFVRSYLIVRDSAGTVTTLYSPVHCADYVNGDFSSPIDNPYTDPFG